MNFLKDPYFLFLFLITIVCSISVIISKNPIHSILFLVLIFILTTMLLLLLGVEFLAMLFLVIYVGAIVVLFLFVVMMLNVRIIELNERLISYIPLSLFIMFIFFILVFFFVSKDFFEIFIGLKNKRLSDELNYMINSTSYLEISNIKNLLYISDALYNDYSYLFILNGIILLVAMIGAIVLTLTNKLKSKRQDYYIQTNKNIVKSLRHFK